MSTVNKVKVAAALSFAFGLPFSLAPATADDFTAKTVMQKMAANERFPYIAGVVEGLAYARYARDNKDVPAGRKATAGMQCVYDWFYKDNKATLDLIYAALGRYGDYTPGAVIAALEKKACGE